VTIFDHLTDAGRQIAEQRAGSDMVARVALYGSQSGWPDAHVATAIKVMNELGAGQVLDTCVICGEAVLMNDDPAEMHDPAMYDPELTEEERMVAQERDPSHGVCHAQCGLDRGWVVS
jgi:hypothetical protein